MGAGGVASGKVGTGCAAGVSAGGAIWASAGIEVSVRAAAIAAPPQRRVWFRFIMAK